MSVNLVAFSILPFFSLWHLISWLRFTTQRIYYRAYSSSVSWNIIFSMKSAHLHLLVMWICSLDAALCQHCVSAPLPQNVYLVRSVHKPSSWGVGTVLIESEDGVCWRTDGFWPPFCGHGSVSDHISCMLHNLSGLFLLLLNWISSFSSVRALKWACLRFCLVFKEPSSICVDHSVCHFHVARLLPFVRYKKKGSKQINCS